MKSISNHYPIAESGADRCHWLDWLRFGAAFLVMVVHLRDGHFADYGDLDPKYHSLLVAALFAVSRLGLESVICFFVLSGFLVGGKSVRRALDGSFGTVPYAIDRLTRIYVPLIPALVLTMVIVIFRGDNVSIWDFLGNLAGLQHVFCMDFGGNGPLWSLAYEIWFYVLCGGVLALAAKISWRGRVVAWMAVIGGLAIFTKLESVYLFCWLLGSLAFLVKPIMPRWGTLIAGLLLTGLGVIMSQLAGDSVSEKMGWVHAHVPSKPVCLLILSLGLSLVVKTVADWEPKSESLRAFERMGAMPAAF